MPRLITSPVARKNLRWDARRKLFVGWQIDVYVHQGPGKKPKRHRTTFPGEAEARSAENRLRIKSENIRLGIERPAAGSGVTVRDLFDRRLQEIPEGADRIRAARVFNHFLETNPDLLFVDDAGAVHFDAWVNARTAPGRVAASTVNREMTHLITAFRRAPKIFRELAAWNPPRMERPKFKKTPREAVIAESDMDAIVRSILDDRLPKENPARTNARPAVAAMFELAWLLGLRLGEIRKLTRRNFSASKRTLRVVRWKTGTVSHLEFLPDRVVALLGERCAAAPGDLLFDPGCSLNTVEKILRAAIEANGLIYGRDVPGGITFHSNRHSFTTRMIQVADLATARSFTGHSNAAMVAYYSHASADSRKAAMERLYGPSVEPFDLFELFQDVRDGLVEYDEFAARIRALWSKNGQP